MLSKIKRVLEQPVAKIPQSVFVSILLLGVLTAVAALALLFAAAYYIGPIFLLIVPIAAIIRIAIYAKNLPETGTKN